MFQTDRDENGVRLRISGDLLTQSLDTVEQDFAAFRADSNTVTVDMSKVHALDTGGAWLIADLARRAQTAGATVRYDGVKPAHSALLETVSNSIPEDPGTEAERRSLADWVASVGERTAQAGKDGLSLLGFLGITLHRMGRTVLKPRRLRKAALVSQMEETGFKAIPIVALMGFLIGVVLAFQGATQLKQFGAEIFVVELISISVLRELGILLTAIIVAGRSGSAFTASIGSMKVQEEMMPCAPWAWIR